MAIILRERWIFLFILVFFSSLPHLQAQTWEVYNGDYELIKKIQNDNIKILGNAVRVSTSNNDLKLLSSTYEPFLSIKSTQVFQYLEPWIIIRENGKFGALHEYGDEVFKTEFDHIESYFNMLLAKKGNAYIHYDRGNKTKKNLGVFESAHIALNGQIIAKTPQGYFLPLSERPNHIYEFLEGISGSIILCREASGYGLLNRDGEYILRPVIDQIEYLGDNYFFAHDGNEYMLIKAMENKADIRYTSYHRISIEEGVILEYIHGKLRRVMKRDGILLDAVGLEHVSKVGEDHYNVYFRDGKVGLLNSKGGWDVRPSTGISKLFPGKDGLFGALIDDKFGFVDQSGTLKITNRFDAVGKFSEGLAAVKTGNYWGYINNLDQLTVQPAYDEAGEFFRGIAVVKKGLKSNLIDKSGKELLPEYYDRVSLTDENYFFTENDGKYGLVSPFGMEMAGPQFEEIRREAYDKIIIRKEGKYGVMMESGEYSLPIYYKNILFDHGNEKILAEEEFIPPSEEEVEIKDKKKKKGV